MIQLIHCRIYSREKTAYDPQRLVHIFSCLFVIAKSYKQCKCSSPGEWINNFGISIQWNTTHQQKGNEPLIHETTWMNLKIIMLSERN